VPRILLAVLEPALVELDEKLSHREPVLLDHLLEYLVLGALNIDLENVDVGVAEALHKVAQGGDLEGEHLGVIGGVHAGAHRDVLGVAWQRESEGASLCGKALRGESHFVRVLGHNRSDVADALRGGVEEEHVKAVALDHADVPGDVFTAADAVADEAFLVEAARVDGPAGIGGGVAHVDLRSAIDSNGLGQMRVSARLTSNVKAVGHSAFLRDGHTHLRPFLDVIRKGAWHRRLLLGLDALREVSHLDEGDLLAMMTGSDGLEAGILYALHDLLVPRILLAVLEPALVELDEKLSHREPVLLDHLLEYLVLGALNIDLENVDVGVAEALHKVAQGGDLEGEHLGVIGGVHAGAHRDVLGVAWQRESEGASLCGKALRGESHFVRVLGHNRSDVADALRGGVEEEHVKAVALDHADVPGDVFTAADAVADEAFLVEAARVDGPAGIGGGIAHIHLSGGVHDFEGGRVLFERPLAAGILGGELKLCDSVRVVALFFDVIVACRAGLCILSEELRDGELVVGTESLQRRVLLVDADMCADEAGRGRAAGVLAHEHEEPDAEDGHHGGRHPVDRADALVVGRRRLGETAQLRLLLHLVAHGPRVGKQLAARVGCRLAGWRAG